MSAIESLKIEEQNGKCSPDGNPFDDKIVFTSGEVGRLIGKSNINVSQRIAGTHIPYWTVPSINQAKTRQNTHRRFLRDDVLNYCRRKGIDVDAGELSDEFLRERTRILQLREMTSVQIVFVTQIKQTAVNAWCDRNTTLKSTRSGARQTRRVTTDNYHQ